MLGQADIDVQPYLRAITTTYDKWWQLYTLTDAQTKTQQEPSLFDFGLMVQMVGRERSPNPNDPARQNKEKIERFPVLERIRKYVAEHRQVLLVGRPGSGKSTTLARLLLEEAHAEQYIPVLVELRFWSGSILDRIQAFFQRHRLQLDRTQIEDLLFHRRLLLLMDGLNELPSETARLDVMKFRQDYPQVSMIFTTRDLSLGGDFGLERKLEMQPLTEAQMQAFVRSYVPEQAEAMLRQLKDRLREFGQTPLLLWMLCGLFRQAGEIPNNLGEVFWAFTQGYERNLKADIPVESDRRWWSELLQELAFWMMRGVPFGEQAPAVDVEFRAAIAKTEARQIFAAFLQGKEAQAEGAAQKYLDDLFRHHLIQPNGEQVEFRHQLLQEYYAAEYLLAHWEQMSELEFKRDYLNYLKWTEPIAFMLRLMSDADKAEQVTKLAFDIDLMLGAKLAESVQQSVQERICSSIIQRNIPKSVKIELLIITRSDCAIPPLLEELKKGKKSSLALKAAFGLWIIGSLIAANRLLEILKSSDDIAQIGAIFALEKINTDEVVSALTNILINGNFSSREEIIGTLGQIGNSETSKVLIQVLNNEGESYKICAKVAESLGKIGDKSAFQSLINLILSNRSFTNSQAMLCRWNAAEALGKISPKEAFNRLIGELNQDNYELCKAIADAIEHISNKEIIPDIIDFLQNPPQLTYVFYVCWPFARALAELGQEISSDELRKLFKILESPISELRQVSAFVLGGIKNEEVSQKLKELLLTELNNDVRKEVAESLGKLGHKEAIPELIKCLRFDGNTAWIAANILGEIGDKDAIPGLRNALKGVNLESPLYAYIISSLAKLDDETVIPYLFLVLEKHDFWTRRLVIEVLSSKIDEKIILNLCGLLADKSKNIGTKISMVEILGRIIDKVSCESPIRDKVISLFRRELEDSSLDPDFRWHIIEAIGLSGDASYLSRFWEMQLLEDTDTSLLSTIQVIQANCKFYNYDLTQTAQSMKLFFSYAHKDEPLRDELAKHLSLLKRQNIITTWHDRNITAGTDWAQAIDNNLNTANIILLLISSDFLASEYCWTKEMDPALERHSKGTARVIPIILRPCDWHSAPFGKLQALPIAHGGGAKPVTQWDNQDEAFTNIAQGIRTAVAELQQRKSSPPAAPPPSSPPQPGNVTMNFYSTVHGAAGTVQGDQNIIHNPKE